MENFKLPIVLLSFFMLVVLNNTTTLQLERILEFPMVLSGDAFMSRVYITTIQIGSPPQDFRMAVSTGSDQIWLKCPLSAKQINVSGYVFNPNKSTSASIISCSDRSCRMANQSSQLYCDEQSRCAYSMGYEDSNYANGLLVFDYLYLYTQTTNLSAKIMFGCSNTISDYFAQQTVLDGVLGLGKGSVSLISQLGAKNISRRIFSHCLSSKRILAGLLLIGEAPPVNLTYTPLIPSKSQYNVNLINISLNESILPIAPSSFMMGEGTIVDSATTFLYLYRTVYKSFISMFMDIVPHSVNKDGKDENICYALNSSDFDTFPSINFYFTGGASLSLDPSDYLSPVDNFYCLGVFESNYATILGEIIFVNKVVVYDVDGQKVGWTKANCSTDIIGTPKNGQKNLAGRTGEYILQSVMLAFILEVLVF